MGPTLSKLEQERIAEAVKLHNSGAPVKFKAFGLRLWYTAGGKGEHLVFTQGSRRVFSILLEQALREFDAETKRLAEARRASKTEATGSQAGTMALETVSSLDRQHAVPDLL